MKTEKAIVFMKKETPMSGKRDASCTIDRVLRVLNENPELTFAQIASIAGISRMHLYRLAIRVPDIGKAYRFCLFLKKAKADDLVMEGFTGVPGNYRRAYTSAQDSMRYEYYLSHWEGRKNLCQSSR